MENHKKSQLLFLNLDFFKHLDYSNVQLPC